ncbi:uncharacterized protein BT62DRAFT_274821 [Guyanagaster necrorhizus]|uniref:Uncharacterized protein n=1 Tax=Guyanagaster necrorhizus TaxID=856835 RepID=A0A9P7W4H4_9AGAR|nr:uncharacterized protein BT62DRAFT_274821 [Guyanagaster necrorhizus MCA 3950]KAG7451992.1 hypothetical protein BT62DRAFT_274821 [Guyanagaster necrorhizus MCA 3950]
MQRFCPLAAAVLDCEMLFWTTSAHDSGTAYYLRSGLGGMPVEPCSAKSGARENIIHDSQPVLDDLNIKKVSG